MKNFEQINQAAKLVPSGARNKKAKANEKNVFALFLDMNTGNVFVYAAESRGQTGPALEAYMQQYGKPQEIVHDNAQEFNHGTFKDIYRYCTRVIVIQINGYRL